MYYVGTALLLLVLFLLIKWGYRWQFWRLPRKGLLCIMGHHIDTKPEPDGQWAFTLTPEIFEKQLDLLEKHGFTPVSLTEIEQARKTHQKIPAKPVLLTFDDGYADNFVHLFPILQKRRWPALIFLVADWIGHRPDMLTWDQARQMQQSGLVEFGSHTYSHARLRSLSNEQILQELTDSKKQIESQLGTTCRAFCYPFGSGGTDKRVRACVFQAGYSFDFATKQGINPWPYQGKKTLLRIFPRGGESLTDFYIQITRGKSRF